jgi:chromosome segregation ATPase
VAAVIASALAMTTHLGAGAETAREQRERIRAERAAAAADIDVLKAEDAEVADALDAMNAEVTAQESALNAAEQAVHDAEAQLANATAAVDSLTQRVGMLEASLKAMAVQQFITGGRLEIDLLAPEGNDLSDWSRRNALARIAIGSATQTGDELNEAEEDLVLVREQARTAQAAAAQHREEVASQLGVVTAARDQQRVFAEQLETRIESRLAESAHLAAVDQRLSQQIAAEQAALARRNPVRARTGGSGTRSNPGNIRLVTVQGITVAESIGSSLNNLLNQAAADGVELSGWGYRDPAEQQALRQAHCPDPENSPSYECRPPTARPGHSMHERGLAIDFTQGGRTLSSGSSGYRWMVANAGSYGLHNLPGEPWHWSTNGD